MDFLIGHYNYWIVIILMMVGLYTVISRGNLIKKIIGLNMFQVSVFLLYISLSKPFTPCIDPYRHRGGCRNNGAGAGAGGAHQRVLRHH